MANTWCYESWRLVIAEVAVEVLVDWPLAHKGAETVFTSHHPASLKQMQCLTQRRDRTAELFG